MTGTWLGAAAITAPGTGGAGPLIGRRAAQILARDELGKVSIWERILRFIGGLFGRGGSAVPTGWFGLIVLSLLVLALIAAITTWVRPARRRRMRADAVLGGRPLSAADYRRRAARLAEVGDYTGAIVEGVRAIAAELDERGILPPRPGRTADELASEAGAELPALATDLRAATELFNDVRYGDRPGRPGTQPGYELVTSVDASARTASATDQGSRAPLPAGLRAPQ
jgi:hypothetical protein